MSTDTKERSPALLDQQLALGVYLDSLLRAKPAEPPPAQAQHDVDASDATAAPAAASAQAQSQAAVQAPCPAPAEESAAAPTAAEESAAAPAAAEESAAAPAAAEPRQWARGRFPCLRFQVAGLTLAVSLQRLNGVLPWPDDGVSPMPGHAPWFLGLLQHQGRQVKIIDTAWHVLPSDRRRALAEDSGCRQFKNIVLIGDGQWGLACDRVDDVMELAPDAVKWRSAGGKRPWLAGTVIAHMCALLDADAFAQVLEWGERQHGSGSQG